MKVYVLDRMHSAGIELMARHADVVAWDDPRVGEWPADADGLMVRSSWLSAEQLEAASQLKVISKQGVGLEKIDLDAAKRCGIAVCHTPGVNSETVAEMALALGLAVSRRIVELDRLVRSGATVDRSHYLGVGLLGKTVGVIGMGNIGSEVARKWQAAFDVRLVAYDPYAPADAWPDLPHRRVSTLDDVLQAADLLTLHLPLTTESKHLLGAREFAMMKEGAILVNASRGGIVDEAALYDALEAGALLGAGLDVFETEPPTVSDPLVRLPNVVATPHAAGGTHETQERSSLAVAERLISFFQGEEPANRVV